MAKKKSKPKQAAKSSSDADAGADELLTRHRDELLELGEAVLEGRTLIMASNRGPVTYEIMPDGDIEGQRGSGGVVTAVSAISNYANPIWVAAAMTEGDRKRAQEAEGKRIQWSTGEHRFRLRFVVVPRQTYEMYYEEIANPLLWFLQHYMWDAPRTPTITSDLWDAWHQGYEAANKAFAEAIADEIAWSQEPPLVMLHDYHLYRCPGELRPKLPDDAILHQFLHVPWPGPDYWAMLPAEMREAIFESLCCNDILAFHTSSYALNFLRTVETFLPDATVDYHTRQVTTQTPDGEEQTTWVRHYPISIDVADLRKMAESEEVKHYEEILQSHTGEMTIVRVDRAEPSKNIVRGFRAFELLLDRYPEYRGKIKFLAFLVPSRLGVEQYQQYLDEISGAAMWINAEYGTGDWEPVELFMGDNYPRAIAAMKMHDVLLVNPIIDGMNLVSKEGPTVNERDGVLVLSEGAGSFEQLGEYALTTSPYDIVGTAQALHRALQMEPDQRKDRAEKLRRKIAEEDLAMWLTAQLKDIRAFEHAK